MVSSSLSQSMLPSERRAAGSLAAIYIFRMLGLFIVLPVFSLFAGEYAHSTPFMVGLAIGVYGIFQAVLQVPFGMLSDRFGRKLMISIGLVLLLLGSIIAATAESIYWVIIGRALQGAGAISAVLMALAADLTRDDQRTKIMALLGASIGFAFVLALMLGPLLITWFSISALFWLTAATAVIGLVLLHTVVPDPEETVHRAETGATAKGMARLLKNPQLLRLDGSIFVLHAIITATFLAVPLLLRDVGLSAESHWRVYLPAMGMAALVLIPMMMGAEKNYLRPILLACVAGLLVTNLFFWLAPTTATTLFIGVFLFFSFLTVLESLFPSLVSRIAPADAKGSAMGVYSSSQFMGGFVGGAGGGWLYGAFGASAVFIALALMCALWLYGLKDFASPDKLFMRRYRLTDAEVRDVPKTLKALEALPGVAEVGFVEAEGVAYLKVDKSVYVPPVSLGAGSA